MVTLNTGGIKNQQEPAVLESRTSGHGHLPLISVVTVVFNGVKTLEKTIESIVPQLGDDVEYIIIDGGSTDGTIDIIREHKHHLAYWISERDSGIYDAWNKAIDASRGKFIAYVGADDVVEPVAFAAYIEQIKRFPDVEYWSARVAFGKRHGRVIGRPWCWHEFRKYMTVAHVGSLHRRDLYARYGKYDTSFRIVGDYEFLLRVGNNLQAGFVDVVTATMGDGGISNKQAPLALKETRLAKISTHACSKTTATLYHIWAVIKLRMRRLLSQTQPK
jgi:glycosyltransferase involved in cell wall biosynthesis